MRDTLLPRQRIAVAAPHPDDFDAIGVTIRRAMDAGAPIHLAVMTTGVNGVDSADYPDLDREGKTALREAEQVASCSFFGLPRANLRFLRLDERPERELTIDDVSIDQTRRLLEEWNPEVVLLPHPHDSNLAHRRTFGLVTAALHAARRQARLLLNCDPKTIDLRIDVVVPFDETEADWKRTLLRHHESQQRRNLRLRGHGLDDRILALNAALARRAGVAGYAEVFEQRG